MLKAVITTLALLAWLPAITADPLDALEQWGQWRGPLGTGVAPRATPPTEWSEDSNVRWKAEIPGKGLSSPIVWGDRVFVTTAVPTGDVVENETPEPHGAHHNVPALHRLQFTVLAFRRDDGTLLWKRTVRKDRPYAGTHETGSWASNSAVTDGEHLVVSFGSAGLYGLDLDGALLWSVDLGDLDTKHGHGEGSSPALSGNTVVVNQDHEGASSVIALDKRNGKELWRVARDEGTSWSTPLIVEHGGRHQVVIAATRRVRGYDLADGRLIWECGGLSGNVVATPVAADGIVHVANSYETRAMLAIRLDAARGDLTGTDAVAWTRDRDTPYVPSPLLYQGSLCFLKHYQGMWTCVRARTGEVLFGPVRLPGIRNVYASPAAANGRVYVVGLDGATLVLEHGPEFAVVGVNRLDDSFSASPAIVGEQLFLRGDRYLYCIAPDPVPLEKGVKSLISHLRPHRSGSTSWRCDRCEIRDLTPSTTPTHPLQRRRGRVGQEPEQSLTVRQPALRLDGMRREALPVDGCGSRVQREHAALRIHALEHATAVGYVHRSVHHLAAQLRDPRRCIVHGLDLDVALRPRRIGGLEEAARVGCRRGA